MKSLKYIRYIFHLNFLNHKSLNLHVQKQDFCSIFTYKKYKEKSAILQEVKCINNNQLPASKPLSRNRAIRRRLKSPDDDEPILPIWLSAFSTPT